MNLVYGLLPAALVLGALGLAAFVWAVRSGQFRDLDTPARRMLFEDDDNEGREDDTSGRTSKKN